jgi:hypothetical protein
MVEPRTGKEGFHRDGKPVGPRLVDFWRWADSDLLSNALRGRLAEYLVAIDIGVVPGVRTEWASYDLLSPGGVKVEVKSAAYVQGWHQERPSRIVFGIAPTREWTTETGEYGDRKRRHADAYVFALLGTNEMADPDPLNVAHWQFYVADTKMLTKRLGEQKTLTLPSLLRLGPAEARFGEISVAIEEALRGRP